jgi:hypothetical protein
MKTRLLWCPCGRTAFLLREPITYDESCTTCDKGPHERTLIDVHMNIRTLGGRPVGGVMITSCRMDRVGTDARWLPELEAFSEMLGGLVGAGPKVETIMGLPVVRFPLTDFKMSAGMRQSLLETSFYRPKTRPRP